MCSISSNPVAIDCAVALVMEGCTYYQVQSFRPQTDCTWLSIQYFAHEIAVMLNTVIIFNATIMREVLQ